LSAQSGGISFAWAKATEGTGIIDPSFVYNEVNGKAAGVYMGAYDFSHPATHSPAAEAGYFWNVAGPYIKADGLSLMPALDFEVFTGVSGAGSYSDWANQWCNNTVNNAAAVGVTIKPVIYTTTCESCNIDGSVAQWIPWIANPNGQDPQIGTPWTACTGCDVWGSGVWSAWQYGQSSSVSGISANVDLDVFNGSSATLVATLVATASASSNRVGIAATPSGHGYWIVASDGGVFAFGDAKFYGSMGSTTLNAPIVGITARPQGDGYWLTGSDGAIYSFGNASYYGGMNGQGLSTLIVGIASTADGGGYWEVDNAGGVYPFGDAPSNGSLPALNVTVNNVVGIARTPSNGYWLVGSDGGVFSFAATFYGSMGGVKLNAPVVGIAANTTGTGYWLVGADGGIFAFNVGFNGSLGNVTLTTPIVAIAATPDGGGYWNVGQDGSVFTFGDAAYLPVSPPPPPVINSVSLTPGTGIQIVLTASSNLTYAIQASTNLVTWTTLTNLLNSGGTFQFTDSDPPTFSQRFYRARWVP